MGSISIHSFPLHIVLPVPLHRSRRETEVYCFRQRILDFRDVNQVIDYFLSRLILDFGHRRRSWQFALSRELCGTKELVKPCQRRGLVPFEDLGGGCRSIWDSDRCFACQGDDTIDVAHHR